MIVRFPLNIIGSSNFVVLDTDYSGSGLVCTSHDFDQIKHEDCNYGEDSGFNINVDKILGQGDEVKITDDNYDLYYGDYEADVEILSSDEIEQIKKEFTNKAE